MREFVLFLVPKFVPFTPNATGYEEFPPGRVGWKFCRSLRGCGVCFTDRSVLAPHMLPENLLDHRLDGSTICVLRVAAAQIASSRFRLVKDTIAGAS